MKTSIAQPSTFLQIRSPAQTSHRSRLLSLHIPTLTFCMVGVFTLSGHTPLNCILKRHVTLQAFPVRPTAWSPCHPIHPIHKLLERRIMPLEAR